MLNNPSVLSEIGTSISGRAVTATLYVSPNGSGADGKTWASAYTTIQAALDAASTDADDCTLIVVSPHTTHYNIDTTGDPTWTGNYILQGTHRTWAKVKNDHAGATSVLKFTGKSAMMDLNINLGTSNNGVIMTHGGARVYHCQFVGEDLTASATALHLDHASGGKHAKVIDCDFLGNGGATDDDMLALLIDEYGYSNFERLRIHNCHTGIQFVGDNSDKNIISTVDIGDNFIGIDIDAGSEQHFYDAILHHNETNIDDEVGDHTFENIRGAFPIAIYPDNLAGIQVDTGAANTYGSDIEIRAGATATKPFRIVGVHMEPSTSEQYQLRFSADSGSTHYDVLQFDGTRREGTAAPSGTEFIFNKGTRISASARDVSGGDNVKVWIEVQEI